jgi:putative FmdB family regulatory protein
MPIYVYRAVNSKKGCDYCKEEFELLQEINDPKPEKCPECGTPVERIIGKISTGSIAFTRKKLDQAAKEKGFHKLVKEDKGRYKTLY